jgi:hypothetical protein
MSVPRVFAIWLAQIQARKWLISVEKCVTTNSSANGNNTYNRQNGRDTATSDTILDCFKNLDFGVRTVKRTLLSVPRHPLQY